MKRILITGANKGIGLATVKKLLELYNDYIEILKEKLCIKTRTAFI